MGKAKSAILKRLNYNVIRPRRSEINRYIPSSVNAADAALWRDFFTVLTFDWKHDFCIWFTEETTGSRRVGPPLLLIYWREDIAPARYMRPLLCTVASDDRLFKDGSSVEAQIRADEAHALSEGWDFRVLMAHQIRSPYLTTAHVFYSFRDSREINWGHLEILRSAMSQLRYCDVETLLAVCSDDPSFRESLKLTLWSAILCGYGIGCDSTAPITLKSVLWDRQHYFKNINYAPRAQDVQKVLPGCVAARDGELFFISHLLDQRYAVGHSLDSGGINKIEVDALIPRADVTPPTYCAELYPRHDGDWLEAQRRLAIISPLLKHQTPTTADVRSVAAREGESSAAVHRWLRNYTGRGLSYCEGGHTMSLVPQGRYKRLLPQARELIRITTRDNYFNRPTRALNSAVEEALTLLSTHGLVASHPCVIRSAISDSSEELVFLNQTTPGISLPPASGSLLTFKGA